MADKSWCTLSEARAICAEAEAGFAEKRPGVVPPVVAVTVTAYAGYGWTEAPGPETPAQYFLFWDDSSHFNAIAKTVIDNKTARPGAWLDGLIAEYDAAKAGHQAPMPGTGGEPVEFYRIP